MNTSDEQYAAIHARQTKNNNRNIKNIYKLYVIDWMLSASFQQQ